MLYNFQILNRDQRIHKTTLVQPRSVHPAAVWQRIQEYPPPYHQTTEQLLSLRLGDS